MITADQQLVEKLNRFIDDNLDSPSFSIDTICQSLGVSRSQLHRIIKEQTDLSTSLYIRKRRLLKAKHLLITSELRISEVCDAVGITNHQNFSTYFTEEFQVNPTDFRKQQAGLVSASPATSDTSAPPLPTAAAEPISLRQPAPTGPRLWPGRRRIYVGVVVGILAILGVGLYAWLQGRSAGRPTPVAGNSLAVMPFINLGAADSGPVCEGIMDEIHRSVSLLNNLKVIARSSSDQYQNTRKNSWQIGNELGVSNLLKGSVLKTDNQLQVKVEIISTAEDVRLWSHTYRVAYANVFTITDQIVRDVAAQLNQKLSPGQAAGVSRSATPNLDAYHEYIKGKQLLMARTGDKLRAAITQFDRAIALDTAFADAYAARASAYFIIGDFSFFDKKASQKLAEKNALEAIRRDSQNGTAYSVLGNIYRLQNKWEQAILTFQVALKYSPNDAQINFWYGITLRSMGRLDEAINYEEKAVSLNPLYPAALIGLIGTYVNAGKDDLARKAIRDGELLFNDAYMFHYARAAYHLNRHEYPQAVAAMHISDSLSNSAKSINYFRLYLRARVIPKDRFETELNTIARTPENYEDLAYAYAGLEDKETCLHYLQLAVDQNLAPDYLKVTPLFAFLHNDPRFNRILRQCNLIAP